MYTIWVKLKDFQRLRPLQQSFGYAINGYQRGRRLAEENEKRFKELRESILSLHQQQHCLSVADWQTLITKMEKNLAEFTFREREASLNSINRNVLNALLSLRPPHDLMQTARNFINARNLKDNLLVKRYLVQFFTKKAAETKLSSEEQQDLLELCNEFIAQEMHLLPEMNEIIAKGLCATAAWKKAFDIPDLPNRSLNTLMRKSLSENDIGLALSSLDKYFQTLKNTTIIAFADYFDRNPKEIPQNVDKLLTSFGLIAQEFDDKSTPKFTEVLNKHGHYADMTATNLSGKCSACGNSLQGIQMTEQEFSILKTEFVKNVVKGIEIRHKTTPGEWKTFERLIRDEGPFDIVMDGMNIAHINSNEQNRFSSKKGPPCVHGLMNAVKQLSSEGKRVLVIGKGRMRFWPNFDDMNRMATVFLAKNDSEDDIFALYAAIYSGNNSFILSNDVMREHKTAIGEHFNTLFKLWQHDHWYRFTPTKNGKIQLVKPTYTHRSGDYWHLPIKSRDDSQSKQSKKFETQQKWVCIKLKTETSNQI